MRRRTVLVSSENCITTASECADASTCSPGQRKGSFGRGRCESTVQDFFFFASLRYWLSRQGITLLDEDQRIEDAGLLMEMMEAYEELETADAETVKSMADENDYNIFSTEKALDVAMIVLQDAPADEAAHKEIRGLLEKLSLYLRLRQKIEAVESSAGA